MENIILECALNYASLGWSVFPCHSIRNGKCTCENDGCDKKGKHPRTPHGYKDGTTDVEKIRKYWTKFPDANIGCATGQVSKIVVLDLDTKHGNSVQVMMKKMSSLGFNIPATASARTGEYLQDKERGAHFFFNCSGVPIESVTNILENVGIKGVDIRADKGYVILAPSAHFTGVSYEWQVSPMLVGLADLPSWIIQKLHTDPESAGKSENKDWGKIFNAEALEGMRNDTATKVAGKLLQAMPSEAWPLGWDLLKAWNLRLTKPLNLGELKTVWNSVEKREKSSKKNKEELTKPEPRVRIPKCPAPSRTVDFEEWAKIISANFPDLRFASEISLAVIAQFLIKDITNPFALVLVDVPSSGKTITINFFSDIPELTYSSDKFTPASFVSNSANVKKEKLGEIDLLPRIQYRMFLIRDMATLFAKRDEDLNELLGILTRVLDGEGLNTDSGVHGQREYNGEYLFMILAASTPISPKVMKVMGNLGSRLFFLKINSRDKGEEELSAQIVDLSYKEKEKACKTITKDFLYGLWNLHSSGVEWNKKNDNKNLLNIVARCSMLLAHLRAVINVWQDDFNNEFKYGSPVIEKPDRLNQLFYNLVRGHALVCGRKQIGIEDLPAVIELCVDGAPSARATLFRKLIEYSGKMTTSEIERELNCSKPTALKEMKTLEIVKICTLHEHANQDNEIKLSDRFKWFLSSECTEIRKLANKAK